MIYIYIHIYVYIQLKGEFAIVPTDEIDGRSLS